jgi:dolichol-phosphate mannosyltransferase
MIVPTYNERTRVAELIDAVLAVYDAHGIDGELVIVDDNSPDGTGAIADQAARRCGSRVRVVHRSGKLGLGTAVMAGFVSASAPVVGVMDADFSHPPERLPAFLDVLRRTGVDVVVGSRYIPGGNVKHWPVTRLLMSRLACLLARPLTPVRDATSGFFLIRRDLADGVRIAAGGFKICLELLIRSDASSIAEVPYEFVDRTSGTSKMTIREALGYFTQLRQLYGVRLASGARRARYIRIAAEPGPTPLARPAAN